MFGGAILLGNMVTWLTPVWLLSVGATAGLIILMVLYGLIWLASRKLAARLPDILREGTLYPLFYLVLFLAAFSLLAAFQMPYDRVISSISRVLAVRDISRSVVVPAETEGFEIPLSFRGEEVHRYELTSDQDLTIRVKSNEKGATRPIHLDGGETKIWLKGSAKDQPLVGHITALVAHNDSTTPASLDVKLFCQVEYPEVYSIPVTALSVVGLFVLYFGLNLLMPKISAIAVATSKQSVAQPIFTLTLALAAFLLVGSIYIPYNTFGEDVKMLMNSGLATIMVASILVALWTASISVSEEIDGRTALTLLSKPIGRRQFIIGKFLGILWPVLLLFIFLGLLFLLTVSYKVVYDARETAAAPPDWQTCYLEVIRTVPGLVLAFMEAVVLASISLAISTRLPMLANLVICATVYVLGHLVPLVVDSSAARFEIVRFVGMLIATIFPVLDHFNIQAAIAGGAIVPPTYLAWALLYCTLYSAIAMFFALFLFEDRDLA